MQCLRSPSPAARLPCGSVSLACPSSSSSARLPPGGIFLGFSPGVELRRGCCRKRRWPYDRRGSRARPVAAAADAGDDDFGAFASSLPGDYSELLSSSEGEESDAEQAWDPNVDGEPSTSKSKRGTPQAAFAVAAHRMASLRGGRRRNQPGVWLNLALFAFLAVFLLFVDWWSWRVVRIPLEPFYFTRPFCTSACLTALAGFVYIPLVRHISSPPQRETFTMGGLFFIPISLLVAARTTHFSSAEVFGAGAITLVFLLIGLLDDALCIVRKQSHGLPGWVKFVLQLAAGVCFSFWFCFSETSSRYNMKFLVPLPQPLGLVYLGKLYLPLTTFCFVSMGSGVSLTDSLDGLAGGTSALAFIGMSVAVLPINPELSIFGASMAGACIGFLVHNRYKASVSMGYTGSSALGGALAAMTACTGMFLPLVLCSCTLLLQVCCRRAWNLISVAGGSFFQVTSFHQVLEYYGFGEPAIVACFYVVSSILCLLAGYVGLCTA